VIADDDKVAIALGYLCDADLAAEVLFNATTKKNKAKETFARLFLSYQGPIAEREARATCNPEYQEAKAQEAEAELELERHKSKVKSCEMIIEIWRSEGANARAAERVR